MENNNLYRISSKQSVRLIAVTRKELSCIAGFMALLLSQEGHAQLVNKETVKVNNGTILSVYMDYDNAPSGNFINDGEVYIFENWLNEGLVDFNADKADGKTFFTGKQEQKISGTGVSNFQNLVFDNAATLAPFQLATDITVNTNVDFLVGVVDADGYNGKMIFNENAFHSNASDLSFVHGQVENKGDLPFEFPVGDDIFFRPSYSGQGTAINNIYTTQYYFQNSGNIYSHDKKQKGIQLINNAEYWEVTQNDGTDKIILSLSLDSSSTPSEFLNLKDDQDVVIVRWDDRLGQWINEGGAISDRIDTASKGAGYTQLLTSQVSGYGIFTMAIVEKVAGPTDVFVFNAVSPNGDGINDTFHIKGIDQYPDNTVEIYNRWGVKVYDATSYNETDNMFRGYSDGRTTIKRGDKLPTGTYFYLLKYVKDGKGIDKSGYLYINNQ